MKRHPFRLLNVFVDHSDDRPLTGNALAVFEDGSDLSDAQMQALALQFNLSETTFLLPSKIATAHVRIYTPTFEMPFAGHPTLGTAHVARDLLGCGDELTFEMKAGIVPVSADGDRWTLEAKAPRGRPAEASRAQLAAMLGIQEREVGDHPMWIDTGSEQLVVRVSDPDVVNRCRPDPALLARHGANASRAGLVYVWSTEQSHSGADSVPIVSRFFFSKHGAVIEDPGTGSACANLGGWFVVTKHQVPFTCSISQGAHTGRPCKLRLHVDVESRIFVTGAVVEIGRGEIAL